MKDVLRRALVLLGICALPFLVACEQSAYVKLTTTEGPIYLELYPSKAPATVKNFLSYVDDGHYAGTVFHRVMDGFMIQGGGFTTNYEQKETKAPVDNEADNGLSNTYGTIAMARTQDPHSATSQFFINVEDNAMLNFQNKSPSGWGYCVFGRVISGFETVEKIRGIATVRTRFSEATPLEPIIIEKAERVTKNDTGLVEQKLNDPSHEEIQKRLADARAAREKEQQEYQEKMAQFPAKNSITGAKEFVKELGYNPAQLRRGPSGLLYIESIQGKGKRPKKTDTIKAHYTGWLANGIKFDSSKDRGEPTVFPLSGVIKGWTEGIPLMREGGKAIFIIPPEIGYGERGAGGVIPPNAVLVFEVELLSIEGE